MGGGGEEEELFSAFWKAGRDSKCLDDELLVCWYFLFLPRLGLDENESVF